MNAKRFESTPPARRALMSHIRSKGTKPELYVRSIVHKMGYRFRLHYKGLPGSPDLAFPGRKKVIFVHGCFWHRHDCAVGRKSPRTNEDYWEPKFRRNVERDASNRFELCNLGWSSLVVWECEIRDEAALRFRIRQFLG